MLLYVFYRSCFVMGRLNVCLMPFAMLGALRLFQRRLYKYKNRNFAPDGSILYHEENIVLLFMSVTGVICYGQQGDSSVTVGKAELDSLRKRIERLESASGDGVRSSERKPEYKIGGWLEARFMYNSYASKSPRENLMFYYPLKPEYGPDGRDIK